MVEPTTHGSRGPAGSGGVAESLAFWQAVLETASAQLLVEQAAREAASRRSARLRALHEAALTMNTVVESEPGAIVSLLAEILRRAVAALDGRDGRIVLTEDPAWRDLTPGHVPAEGLILLDHMAQLRRAPFRADGATEHVLRTGELVHIRDVLEGGRFGPYPQLARHDIRSLVIVPLRISGRVIGSFSVTFGRTHDLLPEDREAVELFAGHAAGAVERARLLHAEQRRAGQAERLAATLARVGAAPDLLRALEALLRGAISLLGGADGIARLFGPEIGDRPLELNIGEDGRLISRVNAPRLPPESLSARLQADGQPILMEDYWVLDPDTFPHYQTMKRLGMRSAVFVPIDGSSGRIGGLSVNHPLPGYFGPADLALAGALAAQAGAAIERARLDAARQAAIRSREEALDALSRQTEALARREAEAVALRELDEMKNEFLTTISHELRTPLTVVHGYAQHLLESARHFSAAEVERVAGQMYANSRQLVRMMQDLVEFARLGRGGAVVQPDMYDIVPQLTELVDAFRQQAGGEHVSLEVPASLTVYADSACVGQVVSNLLDNAIKYAPQGRITLRAGVGASADEAAPTGGWASRPPAADGAIVRVEVQDHGPGIPQQEHPRVWEKLFRGSGVALLNAVRGCGIGLAVVRALVEAHGGRVGLESALGQGTRFWFELPGSAPPPGEAAAPAAVADATGSIGAAPAAASAPEARGA